MLLPGDARYDEVRQIWNAMIDRRPALLARCTSPADVALGVKFTLKNELLLSIRGVGHNIAGNAVCDDGLMLDLSMMKRVQVEPEARRATVEPGCTLADFDAAALAHGLATPLGINSTTGVAGLTLGGGFGWLSRKYGMTVDNLLSADVVLADGRQVRASETENADLFWGLRGGGGNFGRVGSRGGGQPGIIEAISSLPPCGGGGSRGDAPASTLVHYLATPTPSPPHKGEGEFFIGP